MLPDGRLTHIETVACIATLAARQFGLQAAAIDVDVPVRELDVDSLDYLNFVLEIERSFGVDIDYAEATRVPTIRRLAGLVALAMVDEHARVV